MADIKWIKIKTDMFEDEKIKLIDALPERDTIHYIWLRLLVQAGKTNASGYIFLNEIKKMSEELKLEIPKGAGDKVDEVAKVIVQKYGMDKLYNVAKMNFKNTEKVKKS